MSSPNKLTGETNELAKYRTSAAAERTLTSWIQNCLVLIAFGIGFEQILSAIKQSFPGNNLSINLKLTQIIGLSLIEIGILILVLALIQYLIEVKSLIRANYLYKPFRFIHYTFFVCSVILLALGALIAVYIISWH